jgi:D-3-phosphoglycerate dehydrogenase
VCITDSEYADYEIENAVLSPAGIKVERFQSVDEADVVAAAAGATAILVQYASITAGVLDQLPDLKMISRFGTGFDNVDVEAATERGIWVANVPVYGTDEVAVHTFALMLGALRGLPYYEGARRRGDWPPPAQLPEQPADLVLGVLGAGRIGRRVIELAAPLFGKVYWYDPFVAASIPGAERVGTVDALLERSNVLTVHLPLADDTRHTITHRELRLLREPRILVNASRGAIVSDEGLERAIADGTLWAAGLDMLETDPVPAWALESDRILLSPHAGWASRPALEDVRRRAAQNVVDFFLEGRPTTPVNRLD